jgi:VWFA-related protein
VSAETRHGERSGTRDDARAGTKVTTIAKLTRKTAMVLFAGFLAFLTFVPAREPLVVTAQTQQAEQPQRPPVFRAGAHYVRVDAYPTGKDGRIIAGLTRNDFEVYEDGKLQQIEAADYITFDTWTPEAERKDPRTPQDAYDLAADPTWRVFVIVIDPNAYGMEGQHYIRTPLHQFVERTLGPRDLFGVLTTENEWTDLTLSQKTTAAKAIFDNRDWMTRTEYDERMADLYSCGLGQLAGIKRMDDTYRLLEGLVKLLGLVRQERKSIVFVANGLSQPGPPRGQGVPALPDAPDLVPPGGPIDGIPRRGDRIGAISRATLCNNLRINLIGIDFGQRFRDLLRDARQANVAFYPVSPLGLQGIPLLPGARGFDMRAYHAQTRRNDVLRTLANETDGLAIVNTNDLAGGMRRIADDVGAYYVLGYYTTNTTWDGRIRSIKVRLKPKRSTIRARRQYRAPTVEEIAQMTAPRRPPPEELRPRSTPGTPALVGEPLAYRVAPRRAPEPSSSLEFDRTDRIRVEWPVLRTPDRRDVRILDRTGKPLPVDLALSEDESSRAIAVEVPLAAFARGEYAIELHAGSGDVVERRVLMVKVR